MHRCESHPVPSHVMMERVSFLAWFDATCFIEDLCWETGQAVRHFDGACAAGIVFG